MKYVRDNANQTKTILVGSEEGISKKELKELSLQAKAKVYLIPEDTKVNLNNNGWLISASGEVSEIWQFILGWPMPYDCFINGFPFPAEMEELWRSSKPIENVSVDELSWNLDYPWWNKNTTTVYDLTPATVMKDQSRFVQHQNRIQNSDSRFPLSLVETKQGRWLIYDGMHRFVKQLLDGESKFLCQKFSIKEIEKYLPDSHKTLFREWSDIVYG